MTQDRTPWWRIDSGTDRLSKKQASVLFNAVEHIESLCRAQRARDVLHMRMYGNRDVAGLGPDISWKDGDRWRLRYNLAQAICDSLQAKIAKLRPRPRVLSDRGNWGLRKRAQAMELAIDGEFERNDIDDLGPEQALDGFVVGTGALRVFRDGCGHPRIERAYPLELLVDPTDGWYGKPRTLYHIRAVDRDVLMERFGKDSTPARLAIQGAKGVNKNSFPFMVRDSSLDQVMTVEAIHLPSGPDAGDGRRVLALSDGVLHSEEWEKDHFGYSFYRWQKRQFGFWGRGVVEEVTPQQVEINHTLEKIQYILHNVSTVRHWIQGGGRISLSAQKMTNTPGEILRYYGPNPPITDVVSAVPRELFEHVDRTRRDAFAQVGLSELSATSQKPAGLDSGEAIRAYQDVGTERFVLKGRDYERAHMTLSELIIEEKVAIARDPEEDENPARVVTRSTRGETLRTIKWQDVDMEREQYWLKIMPQSALPGTPAGRIATVESWLAVGLITPEEGKELLDFPDVKNFQSDQQAIRDCILSAIESIIEDGEYVPPEPIMDLGLAMRLCQVAYNRHRWEGAPESHLEMLAEYIDAVEYMMRDAQQGAQAQAQAVAPGAPGAQSLPEQALSPVPLAAAS